MLLERKKCVCYTYLSINLLYTNFFSCHINQHYYCHFRTPLINWCKISFVCFNRFATSGRDFMTTSKEKHSLVFEPRERYVTVLPSFESIISELSKNITMTVRFEIRNNRAWRVLTHFFTYTNDVSVVDIASVDGTCLMLVWRHNRVCIRVSPSMVQRTFLRSKLLKCCNSVTFFFNSAG
jgi:hypothetical protein